MAEDDHRVAEIVPPPPLPIDFSQIDLDSPMAKTFLGPLADASAANTIPWRRADMGR